MICSVMHIIIIEHYIHLMRALAPHYWKLMICNETKSIWLVMIPKRMLYFKPSHMFDHLEKGCWYRVTGVKKNNNLETKWFIFKRIQLHKWHRWFGDTHQKKPYNPSTQESDHVTLLLCIQVYKDLWRSTQHCVPHWYWSGSRAAIQSICHDFQPQATSFTFFFSFFKQYFFINF